MTLVAACAGVVATSSTLQADEPPAFAEPRDDSAGYSVETVLDALDHPTSIAVRPGSEGLLSSELYIAESGAGRVIRIATDAPTNIAPVVTGFPLGAYDGDAAFRAGPLGLEFLARKRLVVGAGGLGLGQDVLRVYSLPDDDAPLAYDQADHVAGPVPAGGRSTSGEGAFFSLAKSDRALFAIPHAGDARGWVLKAPIDANRLASLDPFIATHDASGAANPRAATLDPRPNHQYLVIGQMGEPNAALDSRVTMYSPQSGAVALNLAAGLRDIMAMAYSPTGDLYAADVSWQDPASGGVFRLEAAQVDGRESCRPVKVAAVARPTALAFTADGALWVAALGQADGDGAQPRGQLLKITPQGGTPKF